MTNSVVRMPIGHGRMTIVDAIDLPVIREFKWHASPRPTIIYVYGWIKTDGVRQKISLHRFLMRCPSGMEIDHIDGDGLNNSRSNLRICTISQNQRNRHRAWGLSRFKGPWLDRRYGTWGSDITVNGRKKHLGTFNSEEAAARAYDAAAKELFGEFARLNFPE